MTIQTEIRECQSALIDVQSALIDALAEFNDTKITQLTINIELQKAELLRLERVEKLGNGSVFEAYNNIRQIAELLDYLALPPDKEKIIIDQLTTIIALTAKNAKQR